jgi:predicted RNA-binding Zn-ribbon protein involved in translation (DUF1610 family)
MNKKTETRKSFYHQRLEQGLCPRCGKKVKKNSPTKYCGTCLSYYRDYSNSISDQTKADRKKKYKLRKKNHQCTRCGKQLGKRYTRVMCPACLAYARATNK